MIITFNSKTGINGQRLNLVINETLKEFYYSDHNTFNFGNIENDLGIREVQRMRKEYITEGYKEARYHDVNEIWRNQGK